MTLSRRRPPLRATPARAALLAPLTLALLGCSLMSLAGAAQAQSLQDLYLAASVYDATYLGTKAASEAAQFRAEQAYALRRPSVGLSAGVSRTESDTPYSSTLSTNSNVGQVGVSGQQTLFNRANDATISQSERAVQVAVAQLRAAEQDLIVRLSQAYFDVLAASDALGTVQASKKAISEQLASAKRNFEVGTATITDTREAQARYDLAVAQELAADNDLRVKHLALEQVAGKGSVQPLPLAQPVVLPPLQPAQVDAWVNGAETSSPVIAQARLNQEVAQLETEKARAARLPVVALTGSYGKSHVSISGDAAGANSVVPYSASGTGTNATLGVSLTIPLFSGFAIQNRVKETLSLEDKARDDLDAARRGVVQGTRQAYYGVQSGRAQVQALEAAESSSKLALEATELGYKVGVRVNVDVLNAQSQLFQTQRDLAKARYDVIVGDLRLRQATGQLTPDDLAAVNGLLAR
jgi:outer membrane protein